MATATVIALSLSSAQVVVDEGDRIVQLISDKLRNGEDWQAVLAGEEEAVTSRKVRAFVHASTRSRPTSAVCVRNHFCPLPQPKKQLKPHPNLHSRA